MDSDIVIAVCFSCDELINSIGLSVPHTTIRVPARPEPEGPYVTDRRGHAAGAGRPGVPLQRRASASTRPGGAAPRRWVGSGQRAGAEDGCALQLRAQGRQL